MADIVTMESEVQVTVWNHWYSCQSCDWLSLFYWRIWKLHLVWLNLSWNQ